MRLDIESILYDIGVEVLNESGDEIMGRCPMHFVRTGKEDAHPSWSINSKTYVHHCFSCGYAGTIAGLYRDMTGEVPDDLEWELSKRALLASLEPKVVVKEVVPNVDEWVLQNYAELPNRLMERRHLTRESVDFFGIRWDTEGKSWVIPIRSPKGALMGFQYRQKGTVVNYPKGMEKSTTLFGLNLFIAEPRITIVESPLDAVRLHGVGIPAVSSFGASISTEQVNLLARNFRVIISAMDNDNAGKQARDLLHRMLEKRGCVVFDFDYFGLDAKDPGDIESDESLRNAWNRSMNLTNR